jgi:hypothetical protein
MKRICLLALFVLCASFATAADKLWVSTLFGDQLGVIDLGTNTLLGGIHVVAPPVGVLFDPSRGVVYVGQYATVNGGAPGAISVVRASTNTLIDEIPMPNSHCIPFAINAAGNRLYVIGINQVLVIDPYTYAVLADIPVLIPYDLALNADGTRLYIVKGHSLGGTNKGDDRLIVIDAATYAEIASIPFRPDVVDAVASWFALSPDGGAAYVAYSIANDPSFTHYNYMAKIDTKTNKVVAQIPLSDYDVYHTAFPKAFNPSGTKLYLYGTTGDPNGLPGGQIFVFDMNLLTVTANISVPGSGVLGGAYQMTLSQAGDFAYVANNTADVGTPNSASVSLVDLNTNTVVTNIPLPNNAWSGIAVGAPPACGAGNVLARPDGLYSVDADHGLVTDNSTGLIWKRCSEGQDGTTCSGTAATMTWAQALTAGATSTFAGHNDWRVPNVKELETLVETACFAPSINKATFPSTASAAYWSSTTTTDRYDKAWAVYFDGSGNMNYPNLKNTEPSYVRLVRGGRAGASFDRVSPPGDANGDHSVNVSDVFYLVNFLFAGGPAPLGLGDLNGDGSVDVADIFYLINFLFAGGPPPIS